MVDNRPTTCRHRLQDEGKSYPRSSCQACGKTITTGLGRRCEFEVIDSISMSKRELIAMHCLQGLLLQSVQKGPQVRATQAVLYADALLAELAK